MYAPGLMFVACSNLFKTFSMPFAAFFCQVNDDHLVVRDSSGNTIEAQYIAVDNVTINLRNFYAKAYMGVPPTEAPKYWLLFGVTVPPLGWSTYFVSKAGQTCDLFLFSSYIIFQK